MKLNRSNYKVAVTSKKQAKQYKQALLAVGEEVHQDFWTENCSLIKWCPNGKRWLCCMYTEYIVKLKEITFKELITLIVSDVEEVKPVLLDGKVAIQISNEREFESANDHFKDKFFSYETSARGWSYPMYMCYQSSMNFNTMPIDGYRVIPFADFAAEVGIEIPVFVMKSEDGIDLREGDFLIPVYRKWEAGSNQGEWYIEDSFQIKTGIPYTCQEPESFDKSKAFSTRVAAEKWVAEQNNPKEIIVSADSKYPIKVTKDQITILCANTVNHADNIIISVDELRESWLAYKSLQGA